MVGKAAVKLASSRRATLDHGFPLDGNGRADLPWPDGRAHRVNRGREGRSAHGWISGLLALCFLLASLLAFYEVATIPGASSNAANTSKSIQTIRHFYAGLNEFMETGDASAVSKTLDPGALAFVPEQGVMGDDSGLLTYLLALRSTLPRLRFTIERIDAGGDIAIASVRRSGTEGVTSAARPGAASTSQEFFRVRDSHIVQHWTTEPGSMLLHPITKQSIRTGVTEFRHLAMAELTFAPHERDPQPIDGPALIIVQHGRLTLIGDGSSEILDMATGSTSVPGPDENVFAEPGQAISILDRKAFVRNSESDEAGTLIASLVDDRRQTLLVMEGQRFPPPAINDITLMVSERSSTYGAVTIRPLEFDVRSIPVGNWEFEIGWAVLGPGTSLPPPSEGEWEAAHVIFGPASPGILGLDSPETPGAVENDGGRPAVALVMRIRPAP